MASPTLAFLADELAAGRTTSVRLTEDCLARIADPAGEGSRTFTAANADGARATAKQIDAMRAARKAPSRFAGIPISVKDLFDVAGQVTRAGSTILADRPPAEADAPIVARLRAVGFVIVGRTNMSEFAYSGLGLNPHYGTPRNPWDRAKGRAPGGSSSGAAISVTDGMSHVAIGTDTGGSCRIPAAFTGIVGYKPTARSVPLEGSVPLSPTLDSIGPLAHSVHCCAVVHSVLSGTPVDVDTRTACAPIRLALPTTLVLDSLDPAVSAVFSRAVAFLADQGIAIDERPVRAFGTLPDIISKGGFAAAESYAWHRDLIHDGADQYDPRVLVRIMRGRDIDERDFKALQAARDGFIASVEEEIAGYDAIILPAVAIVAPPLDALVSDADYSHANAMALRNTGTINVLDGCAISIPIHRSGEAPVGLMLAAARGRDAHLFQIAADIEAQLRPMRLS